MSSPLDRAEAALVPIAGLAALAGRRARPGVQAIVDGDRAWVTWPPGEAVTWQLLAAAPGVVFFERRAERWHSLGRRLPAFDVPPPGEPRPLDAVLHPAPAAPVAAPAATHAPARLRLVRGTTPRPAAALRATFDALAPWAETAPGSELHACRAAAHAGRLLLLGPRLPPVAGERFWGERVLTPLGMRPDPDLPESALRAAAGVALDELLLLTEAGPEAARESALRPLTRAAFRAARAGSAR